jgi:hypothetical protein
MNARTLPFMGCIYYAQKWWHGDSRVPVAHTYNPSYSGGRDQEDLSSKPAWSNSLWDPISKKKKNHHKKVLVEWLKV